MRKTQLNENNIKQVVSLVYEEKKEFYDELFGSNAQKYIKKAFDMDVPPFIKRNCIVLESDGDVKGVLLYATKAEFRHGYQRWFNVLGFKIVPVGSKMIYIIQRLLMDFAIDDLYIVSLAGELKEWLLYKYIKSSRYRKIIVDALDSDIFARFNFTEERPVHPKLRRFSKFCDYENMGGIGWDTHPLVEGRKLIIGGVEIDSNLGLQGHSDADVLSHAIIDSLVGVTLKSDIGSIFPENDENRGRSSIEMLDIVVRTINKSGFFPSSVDCVIISPIRLKNYRKDISQKLEDILRCPVSVKFKSGNDVYPESQMKGITAICVSNVDKIS
ncbi:MAG: 2-C-methyl-D-erythritol 2,4-cyclodiphosphate synthase [Fervidobacterium sp.]|uniref:2-C-methyl-D-erythritol 2,4-cyclodiphosphate synthase n=1 Tax=Fervidobacterium gondwanense DSM 13020 TaxID=1121883 RepID=A0A1M7RU80_FERGO|nr:2-C-methyl-D-erythritol 2,4-cyclodiphosphate synthase [Fervidobacterium gondwanense]UXF01890.1 2-C-methyl-D-erythritol 2,4-cyclodiphosphate synthase [Fervidobacterium riparium]SHN49706.1 2-C-methyl-D-erythritol 2,4-cyclodiphosphate synthase [Fervidobacterium gondwanense DSM 13020]